MLVLLIPLLGILFLLWGAWTSFRARRPFEAPLVPPLAWRVAIGVLGAAWGWLMANLAYAPDAAHRVVGFPLPVYQWVNHQGLWIEQSGALNLPFLLLDILIYFLVATKLLKVAWDRIAPPPVKARRRR